VAYIGGGGGNKNYIILVGKPLGKSPLEKPWRKLEDNIKMHLKDVGCVALMWMKLTQDLIAGVSIIGCEHRGSATTELVR
jgi:hypothetical protein